MAAIDHSQTYKEMKLKNIPHLKRKRDIERVIKKLRLPNNLRYADFGCSNGYLTKMVSDIIKPQSATGFDHTPANLQKARENYKDIEFKTVDLNRYNAIEPGFDFITCFETIEHVGRPDKALESIWSSLNKGGKLLISVPIEVGPIGILKFFVKNYVYRYSLDEISSDQRVQKQYVRSLLRGSRLGSFRQEKAGWGTHYGFDYRDFEDLLNSQGLAFTAWSNFATRFYLVERSL